MSKYISLLCFIGLFSCIGEVAPCPSVSENYSKKLESSIRETNERLRENLMSSYSHFDQALAMNYVTGFVANIDSVNVRGFELREYCLNFIQEVDDNMIYETFDADGFINLVEGFKSRTTSLIPNDKNYHDGYFAAVDSILNPNPVLLLGDLTKNEFLIEKELYKGRFIEVEYLTVESLLSELDYTKKEEK